MCCIALWPLLKEEREREREAKIFGRQRALGVKSGVEWNAGTGDRRKDGGEKSK